MLAHIVLISQLSWLVVAVNTAHNQFFNPPADPIADPSTSNDVVVFIEGTTVTLSWITTFNEASLALLPLGTDPVTGKSTAEFLTRNATVESIQWLVSPPPGLGSGSYFFELYQEGLIGRGSFGSHTFAINVITTSSTPTISIATSQTIPFISTTASITIVSSIPAIITSSALPTTTSIVLPSTTFTTSNIIPVITSASTFNSTAATTIIPAFSASVVSMSSLQSTISTTSSSASTTISNSLFLPSTQNQINQPAKGKRLTTFDEIIIIIIPITILFGAISFLLIRRFMASKRGVEATMKKSMKVKEMPRDGG